MSPIAVMPKKRILPWRCSVSKAGSASLNTSAGVSAPEPADAAMRVVELEQIDGLALQPGEARLQRGDDGRADGCRIARGRLDLGGQHDGGLQGLQHAAEVGLRGAVAVLRRGVEIGDAELERARHRALLVARLTAHHQAADVAAAEAEDGSREAGAAEGAGLHGGGVLWGGGSGGGGVPGSG